MTKQIKKKQKGRSMIEMLGVLAIIGVLSIAALFGFNYAMNRHKANETIYDVMIRGTNVPMMDEYYASKPSGYQFLFPDLTDGTYYAMETLKDTGRSYYVDVAAVPSKVCTQVLNLNPTDIDAIVVEGTLFTGNNTEICGNTPVQMRFCFGTDGTVCNGSSHGGGSGGTGSGGSGSGSGGSGSGSGGTSGGTSGSGSGSSGSGGSGGTSGSGTGSCTSDPECGALEICLDQTCVPVECKADADCTSPKTCADYACVCPQTPTPTTCQEIVSLNGCQVVQNVANGTNCAIDDASGTCQEGVCELPKSAICVSNSDCESGRRCSNNFRSSCVGSNCLYDEEICCIAEAADPSGVDYTCCENAIGDSAARANYDSQGNLLGYKCCYFLSEALNSACCSNHNGEGSVVKSNYTVEGKNFIDKVCCSSSGAEALEGHCCALGILRICGTNRYKCAEACEPDSEDYAEGCCA